MLEFILSPEMLAVYYTYAAWWVSGNEVNNMEAQKQIDEIKLKRDEK